MFKGFGSQLGNGLKIESPTSEPLMPEFAAAHVTNASSIFPDAKPAPKPLLQRLLDCDQSPQRDALLGKLALLSEEVERFLLAARAQHIAALQLRREEQRARCRAAEDALKDIKIELAQARQRLDNHAPALNSARRERMYAEHNPVDSAYQSPSEIAAYQANRSAAQEACSREEARHRELEQSINPLVFAWENAGKMLSEADEVLRSLDSELRNLIG
jgi:chromosome segregation ATPase